MINFMQGGVLGTAGRLYEGAVGSAVTVSNSNDAGVTNWKYELLDVPDASALVPGVLSNGGVATATFTPDVVGGYRIKLTTTVGGTTYSTLNNFYVLTTRVGLYLPTFRSEDTENVRPDGESRGWAAMLNANLGIVDYTFGLAIDGMTALGSDMTAINATLNAHTTELADHETRIAALEAVSDPYIYESGGYAFSGSDTANFALFEGRLPSDLSGWMMIVEIDVWTTSTWGSGAYSPDGGRCYYKHFVTLYHDPESAWQVAENGPFDVGTPQWAAVSITGATGTALILAVTGAFSASSRVRWNAKAKWEPMPLTADSTPIPEGPVG